MDTRLNNKYDPINNVLVEFKIIILKLKVNLAEENVTRDLRRNGADYLMILKDTGKVKWHFQTISKSFCRIDIMEFPFDTQVLKVYHQLFFQ